MHEEDGEIDVSITPTTSREGKLTFNLWIQSHDVQSLLGLMLHMQDRVEKSQGGQFMPKVTFSLQNLVGGKPNSSCTVTLGTEFFRSISERNTLFPKDMTPKQKINSFVLLSLIFSSKFNPSMSIFKEQGKEPLALLIKIIMDITAHFGHKSEEAMKAIWLSNDNALCNEEAIHLIYSLILFKSGTGGILATYDYGQAIVDPNNASKIITPFALDSAFGSYFLGQKTKLKPYQQFPGVEGFPMASHRVMIGFMDLLEGSHVRLGEIERTISNCSNTVQLSIGTGFLQAIPITPYLYMMYSSNMQKCFFTKRCHHTTTKIENDIAEEKCRKTCTCVKYHYFNVLDLIPDVTQEETDKMIREGIFCNAQCGRQKLSKEVIDRLTPETLKFFLSVFKNPHTQIGHQRNTNDQDKRSASGPSSRARTGSGEDDVRRELIPDIDDATSGDKEQQ